MRTLEEARDTLQISQEDIDFLVDGIRRAGEPAAKPGRIAIMTSSVFPS